MAEITTTAASGKTRGTRSKKLSTKVDLTPMVDLGFLLISFFMITTTLQEEKAMKMNLPADGPSTMTGESTTITLLAGEKERVFYYNGSIETALAEKKYGITDYSLSTGIGDILRQKKQELKKLNKDNDLVVLLSLTDNSAYKNLVDLLDEMLINAVPKYILVDNEQDITVAKKAGVIPLSF